MDATTQGLINVSRAVRLIALQFSFSNPKVVPRCIHQREDETPDETRKRARPPSREPAIAPVENVGLVEFLGELERGGYAMVDAFSQRRNQDNKGFSVVRFVFARCEYAQPTNQFVNTRPLVQQALHTMCVEAMWQVRAFLNPLIVGGQEVCGEHAVDICLTARKPLLDNLGNPVKVWRKDADGNRLGDAATPIQPDYLLRFTGDQIQVHPAPQATAV
ncbi:MAG: hypothetical protein G01um101438_149 [Parcubacteria group bacterium Gr01-1014_38]|nr:MAG: hypothetical protein G01um101438_149 [Parcubacteria group bacterium Gr01-1014_38]